MRLGRSWADALPDERPLAFWGGGGSGGGNGLWGGGGGGGVGAWQKELLPDWARNGPLAWKRAAVLTTLFWSASSVTQRVSGALLGMHSGRPYPLTVVWGVLTTTCSLLAAQHGTKALLPELSAGASSSSFSFSWARPSERQETIYHTLLGFASYGLLERRNFRTALPSSVITTGVYAHTPLHWRWSRMRDVVIASSDVATAAERSRMQVLGRLHGCHHCGSRQLLLPRAKFIADHMPPTLVVGVMNKRWWRRWLGFQAKQQLLPQCQSCFSVQGAAVKAGLHRLIFHSQLRAWHLAPALAACVLAEREEVRAVLWPAVVSVDGALAEAGRAAARWLDRLD